MITQAELLVKAKCLANQGKEYGDIVGKLEPEMRLRLKAYVLNLDEELATETIFGAVTWKERINVPRGRGRPKK